MFISIVVYSVVKRTECFLMTMNSTHLENSKNLKSDNQLILLKAYKRKTARQEKWMFFEKAYDKNKHKKRIESLSDYNDKSDVYIDTESDIVKTLSAQELHKCLLVALDELTDLERLIIDEVFFLLINAPHSKSLETSIIFQDRRILVSSIAHCTNYAYL